MDTTSHYLMDSISGKIPPYSFKECKLFQTATYFIIHTGSMFILPMYHHLAINTECKLTLLTAQCVVCFCFFLDFLITSFSTNQTGNVQVT